MVDDESAKAAWDPQERFEARLPRQEEEVARLSREVRTGDADPEDLAQALSRLSATLGYFKRTADRLPREIEEVSIRRQLAADHSVRRRGELAFALLGLAQVQKRLGHTADEAATLDECVAIYRKVTRTRPLRYSALLAAALRHLAEVRLAETEVITAFQLAQESLELWRQAQPDPSVFADDVTEAEAFVARVRGMLDA